METVFTPAGLVEGGDEGVVLLGFRVVVVSGFDVDVETVFSMEGLVDDG